MSVALRTCENRFARTICASHYGNLSESLKSTNAAHIKAVFAIRNLHIFEMIFQS